MPLTLRVADGAVVVGERESPAQAAVVTTATRQNSRGTRMVLRSVYDPVHLEERVDEGVPLGELQQVLSGANQIELFARVGAPQCGDKLPAKHAIEDLHR